MPHNQHAHHHHAHSSTCINTTPTQERLPEAYAAVATQLQGSGDLKGAERYWIDGRQWQAAVHMYAERAQWHDALRVALRAGGTTAGREVRCVVMCYVHARCTGGVCVVCDPVAPRSSRRVDRHRHGCRRHQPRQ